MVTRRRVVTSEELDVHTRWRHVLCYLHRAGAKAAVKRRTNRRERREGQREIREWRVRHDDGTS